MSDTFERLSDYTWFTVDTWPDLIFLKDGRDDALAYNKLGDIQGHHHVHWNAKVTNYGSNPRRMWR